MNNFKRYFVDFINFTLIWAILVFIIAIIALGSKIEFLTNFFKSLIPLAFFTLILLIVWKIERSRLNKLKYRNATDVTLYLSANYRFADKIIIFALPVLMIMVSFLRGSTEIFDIIQATLVMGVLLFWHLLMFSKL
jgi:hypothetical protein